MFLADVIPYQELSKSFPRRVKIGDEWRSMSERWKSLFEDDGGHPELVPWDVVPEAFPGVRVSEIVEHLEWMLKKDSLGQDIFLIGPPGEFI